MNEIEAYARNQRFSGRQAAILVDCPDDHLALFSWGGSGQLLYLGTSGEELLAAFRARPGYVYKLPPVELAKPKLVAGINIADLEIDI